MTEVRERAKKILDQVPEPPQQITSDGATGPTFERLTGTTHAAMLASWAGGGLLTACNGFVGVYGKLLGAKVYLGRFDLETYLPTIGKGNTWVKSTTEVRPKYGDICRHTAFHIGVSLDFEGENWKHADAGQGGPKMGRDVLKRIYSTTPYNPANLQGWIDLDLYFPADQGPFPEWLAGWWKVVWRGTDYFYYFDRTWQVKWTQTAPGSTAQPLMVGNDTGSVSMERDLIVTVTWSGSGTVEKFTRAVGAPGQPMQGKWRDLEPLTATKL
jgi:hypothetical protein